MEKSAATMVRVKAEPQEQHHGGGGGSGSGSGSNSSSSRAAAQLTVAVDPPGSSSSYVFVLPKNSPPPATVTVTFAAGHGGGDKKDTTTTTCKDKYPMMAVQVVRMGPCGGAGGDAIWDMDVRGVNRIVKIVIRQENAVDAMSVAYERDGLPEQTKRWGGQGGKRSEIDLEPDEHLIGVRGHYGQMGQWFVIRSLTFVSNRRRFGPYGKEKGVPFELPAAGGGKIVGFHARSGSLLDALGIYYI